MRNEFPIATAGQRVGLLGGSFDPAHEGHVRLTEEALKRFGLDRVWWLVTPGNPLKAHGPAPLPERIAYARQIMDDPRVTVTGIEAALKTRKTVDTITALQAHYPEVRFTWLMGSDNLVQLPHWDRWHEIATRVPIGVLARPGSRLKARITRMPVRRLKTSLSMACSCAGSMCSDMRVKPRMSQNMTVISWLRACML